MSTHFNTPVAFNPLATKKDRAAAAAAFATMVRWCRANLAAHHDGRAETDATALALACAAAHGCDDPGADHPAWDAAIKALD